MEKKNVENETVLWWRTDIKDPRIPAKPSNNYSIGEYFISLILIFGVILFFIWIGLVPSLLIIIIIILLTR
jgi:hypothetical protein